MTALARRILIAGGTLAALAQFALGDELNMSDVIWKPGPTVFQVYANNSDEPVMVIHADGQITVSKDAKPDETARQVLNALEAQIRALRCQEPQP
jgi:hypothetical protein